MNGLWFSRPYDFMGELETSTREDLIACGQFIEIAKDQLIFNAGAASDNIYILLDGRIKIYELSADGREVILWFCFPGEVFGLAEIVKGSHRVVHAQSCSKVQVLSIQHQEFLGFLERHPAVSLKIIELLSCRLRELGDLMSNLVSDDVRSRVVKLMTRLAVRYGVESGAEVKIDIILTHQEMADMTGTSRQTFTTVLNKLKREGYVRVENKVMFLKQENLSTSAVGVS